LLANKLGLPSQSQFTDTQLSAKIPLMTQESTLKDHVISDAIDARDSAPLPSVRDLGRKRKPINPETNSNAFDVLFDQLNSNETKKRKTHEPPEEIIIASPPHEKQMDEPAQEPTIIASSPPRTPHMVPTRPPVPQQPESVPELPPVKSGKPLELLKTSTLQTAPAISESDESCMSVQKTEGLIVRLPTPPARRDAGATSTRNFKRFRKTGYPELNERVFRRPISIIDMQAVSDDG
jgi:DNA-binding transcriptional regulator YhcF (GntR family)